MKFIFLLALYFSIPSLAQNYDAKDIPAGGPYPWESEGLRAHKMWDLHVQLFGVGPAYDLSESITLGYFLDRNNLIQVEVGEGNNLGRGIGDDLFDFTKVRSSSVGINFKHFVSNSFYFVVGLSEIRTKYQYDDGITSDNASFTTNSLHATIDIGNEWQWEDLNLGCDWIGSSLKLNSTVTDENPPTTSGFFANYSDDRSRYTSSFTTALRFYIGASF